MVYRCLRSNSCQPGNCRVTTRSEAAGQHRHHSVHTTAVPPACGANLSVTTRSCGLALLILCLAVPRDTAAGSDRRPRPAPVRLLTPPALLRQPHTDQASLEEPFERARILITAGHQLGPSRERRIEAITHRPGP